ncbi:MAG: hypothetical protein WBP82_10845 [Leuconostoc mesenteroides]
MNELEKSEYLEESQESRLEMLEQKVIDFGNLALENAVRAGEILETIREEGLYKKKRVNSDFPAFADFGEYAKAKFGRGKTMSYNYIHISKIMNALEEEGFNVAEISSIQNAMQVYFELKKLGYYNRGKLHPLFREVLNKSLTVAENISIITETGEIKITPESIQAAFQTVQEIVISESYEVDGEQIPMKLGAIAVDDQASQIMYEQVQRRRLVIGQEIEEKKRRRFEVKTLGAFEHSTELKKNEEVTLHCPKHFSTSGEFLTKAGIKMSCGCYAILETAKNKTKLVWYKDE